VVATTNNLWHMLRDAARLPCAIQESVQVPCSATRSSLDTARSADTVRVSPTVADSRSHDSGLRKVLMVCKDFWPCQSAGAQRMMKFAQHLPEHGWEPIILTASERTYPQIDRGAHIAEETKRNIHRAVAFDNKTHLSLWGKYPGFLDRPDRFSSWYVDGIRRGSEIIAREEPEAIFSTYPVGTAHAIARALARRHNLPWIAEFRDPVTTPFDGKRSTRLEAIERMTIRNATRLVFVTPDVRELYEGLYPGCILERSEVIENGFNEEVVGLARQRWLEATREADRAKRCDRVVFLHNGHLYGELRDPTALLHALRELLDEGRLPGRPQIVFQGTRDAEYDALVARLGLGDHVVFRASVPNLEATEAMFGADVLLLMQGSKASPQIPSKAYEYLAAGRPILALAEPGSAVEKMLRDVPWAVSASLGDVAAIKRAFPEVMQVEVDPAFDPLPYGRARKAEELTATLDRVVADGAAQRLVAPPGREAHTETPDNPFFSIVEQRDAVRFGCDGGSRMEIRNPEFLRPDQIGAPVLLTLVDVEEEFDWDKPWAGGTWQFEALEALGEFHQLLRRYGVVPCYMVDYPVAAIDEAADLFRRWAAAGECVVGAQLHTWQTPPMEEARSLPNSFQGNLPRDLERRKMVTITELIEDRIGVRPRVFRAGRYGIGGATPRILEELGYQVDVSIMPNTSYAAFGRGPSAVGVPDWPFWLNRDRTLLEIPVTRSVVGRLKRRYYRHPTNVFDSAIARGGRATSFLSRARLLERITLTPEGQRFTDIARMIDEQLAFGQRVFTLNLHSSSLVAGGSSYVPEPSDVAGIFDNTRRILDFCMGHDRLQPRQPLALLDEVAEWGRNKGRTLQ